MEEVFCFVVFFFLQPTKSLGFMLTGVVNEDVWLQVMFQTVASVNAKASKQSNTPAT